MHLLYEEGGDIKVATVLSSSGSGDTESWQASALSGKHLKLKAKEVWLRFDDADLSVMMNQAQNLSSTIDLQLLWDCSPEGEFIFSEIAREYFGDKTSNSELVALAVALQGAPVFFRRKGRGRFQRAPKEQLQAGLAAIERKQKESEQQSAWQKELEAGHLPEVFRQHCPDLLFSPDKNSGIYKALMAACNASGESPPQLMIRCGALESPLIYHEGIFLKNHFPSGSSFSSEVDLSPEQFSESIHDLPLADVHAFSIDDASTTEIDDALSVTPLDGGHYQIGIHIAAPGLGIQKDDLLDQLARARMSTVYFPGGKITMLPESVIQLFSLDEGKARPALSLYVEVNSEGMVLPETEQTRIELVPIAHNLRLNALEDLVTEESLQNENVSYPYRAELLILWNAARQLHRLRQTKRQANALREEPFGPGDPQALVRDFHFNIENDVVQIEARQRGSVLDSIVAEWMIFCNSSWGRRLAENGLPALFRTQKGWGPQRTRMQTNPAPHEGLGLDYYAWCTSPLRRYSDLVNQWQMMAIARYGVTAKMLAPFVPKDATLMGIAADFETSYQVYAEHQDRIEKFWCLRWIEQTGMPCQLKVRHLKEGMARVEKLPLYLAIPELTSHPRMTVAEIEVIAVDLLQLSASIRVLHIEATEGDLGAELGLEESPKEKEVDSDASKP